MAGGGGSNNAQIYQQQQAAQEARQKEEARAARLQQGKAAIDALFEGAPVMGTRATQTTWGGGDAPAGFTKRTLTKPGGGGGGAAAPITGTTSGGAPFDASFTDTRANLIGGRDEGYGMGYDSYGTGGPDAQGYARTMPTTAFGAPAALTEDIIVGPDGREYRQGDLITGSETYDTGARSGGIGDDFYNKFRQAQTDYYLPDVERQFGKAKDQLTYNLARAGTSQSSIAGEQLADLIYQNQNNVASVNAKADAATADLRKRVASEKSAALSQLYATEDPSLAANEALSRVRTINDVSPELNPLGDIFKLAAIGGGQFASSYGDPYNRLNYGGSSKGSGRNVS